MNVQPYNYSCFGSFVRDTKSHPKIAVIVYLFSLTFFITMMSLNSFDTATKAIIGYSYLSAHVIMALIFVPFRKELQRQQEHQRLEMQALLSENYFATIDDLRDEIDMANYQMMYTLGPWAKKWPLLEAREKDVTNLMFEANEMSHACMRGVMHHPNIPGVAHPFYAIKMRSKNNPQSRHFVITFSQRDLMTDVPADGQWYYRRGANSFVFTGLRYFVTSPSVLDFQKILDGIHPIFEPAL